MEHDPADSAAGTVAELITLTPSVTSLRCTLGLVEGQGNKAKLAVSVVVAFPSKHYIELYTYKATHTIQSFMLKFLCSLRLEFLKAKMLSAHMHAYEYKCSLCTTS